MVTNQLGQNFLFNKLDYEILSGTLYTLSVFSVWLPLQQETSNKLAQKCCHFF